MIGLKLNRQTLRHAYHKTKNFVGQAYAHTKGMLSDLDMGVSCLLYTSPSPRDRG